MARADKIHLGVFYWPGGHHVAGWRHPEAETDCPFNYRRCVELAQLAERGKFDLFFLADLVGIRPSKIEAQANASRAVYFEPLTLLAALSTATEKVGLVATATTTYNEPYHLARKFASLDLINGGRTGWNLVTSHNQAEAANFNRDTHMAHADRYERADEFVEIVKGLWDSWDDGSFVMDKESGQYFEPGGLHFLNHRGKHFLVRGPLNVPRSPQGHPVIIQAGSSGPGRELAARTAEVIFTAAETLADGQAFYADVKQRMAEIRDAAAPRRHHARPLPRHRPHRSRGAREIRLPAIPRAARCRPVPARAPARPRPLHVSARRTAAGTRRARRRQGPHRSHPPPGAPRQPDPPPALPQVAVARGHNIVIGTPEQIADVMQEWFEGHAADGFNILPPVFPTGLQEFVDLVVPELQRRGLFRTEYEGSTLREHLGLPYPKSRHTAPPPKASASPPPRSRGHAA